MKVGDIKDFGGSVGKMKVDKINDFAGKEVVSWEKVGRQIKLQFEVSVVVDEDTDPGSFADFIYEALDKYDDDLFDPYKTMVEPKDVERYQVCIEDGDAGTHYFETEEEAEDFIKQLEESGVQPELISQVDKVWRKGG